MTELHIVESHFFGHLKKVDESAPVLFFKRFSTTELDDWPGLLVLLDLLKQESSYWSLLLGSSELFRPLEEEVLEGKVVLFAVSEPLFLAHLVEFDLELLKLSP